MSPIDPLRAMWLSVTALGVLFTVWAYIDARRDRARVKSLNGKARELTAANDERRAFCMVIASLLLFAVGIASLFANRTVAIVTLSAVPVVLLYVVIRDRLDRRNLIGIKLEDIETERRAGMKRLEAGLAENTRITVETGEKADRAYVAANQLNEKIADQGDRIEKGLTSPADKAIANDTHEKVGEIHDRVVRDEPERSDG